jgi:hypothetical protein
VEPSQATWHPKVRPGTLASSILPTSFNGWLQINEYATNLDGIIDFSSAVYAPATSFFFAAYTQATPGSGKVYRAQYRFQPTTGVLPSVEPTGSTLDPTWSTFVQCAPFPDPRSQQFVFHVGGFGGALSWGIELCAISLVFGTAAENLWLSAIAHGVEL